MVSAVIDGETIAVDGYGRVKLAGIKAPRLGRGLAPDAPFARAARDRLEGVVIRRYVRLEFESQTRRAYVLLEDGTLVNALLVREGLASAEAPRRNNLNRPASVRRAEITRAEEQARTLRRGIWSAGSRR